MECIKECLKQIVFFNYSPNWFEWLSLIVMVLSIFSAYLIAKYVYNKEKKDKNEEYLKLITSENELFNRSLKDLAQDIEKQVISISEYIEEKNFRLKINPAIQIDFLRFIDIKSIYEINPNKSSQINDLVSSLYTLSDFENSIKSELRHYIKRYNELEVQFKDYRQILYTKYYEITNIRNEEVKSTEKGKVYSYNPQDNFMSEYTRLVQQINSTSSIITDKNENANHQKINDNLIIPMIDISGKYIPEDYHAILINTISNNVHSAFIDMENLTKGHFIAVKSHQELLKDLLYKIKQYINNYEQSTNHQ